MKPKELQAKIEDQKVILAKSTEELNNFVALKEEQQNALELAMEEQKQRQKIISNQIEALQTELVDLSEQVEMESFGLYKPRYSFASALDYKDRLMEIRNEQKSLIKQDLAYNITFPLTFNNSLAKGKSIQKKNGKQLLRSFNGECEAAINKVTHSNIDRIELRLQKSFDQLNKLNKGNGVELSVQYLSSKNDELHVAFEYELKKYEEKEELREQRQREREERQLQKEIDEQRKKVAKDLDHFENMRRELDLKLTTIVDPKQHAQIEADINELEIKITNSKDNLSGLDYREQNATAGYVYIISNIGSFGEDVVKIGVTRRLEPMDRIDELGSASVPFKFDVHALIFSYDAYQLESELHNRFSDQRINKVNARKEYFRISLDQVKEVLHEYSDLTIDFHEVPEAVEYREGLQVEVPSILS